MNVERHGTKGALISRGTESSDEVIPFITIEGGKARLWRSWRPQDRGAYYEIEIRGKQGKELADGKDAGKDVRVYPATIKNIRRTETKELRQIGSRTEIPTKYLKEDPKGRILQREVNEPEGTIIFETQRLRPHGINQQIRKSTAKLRATQKARQL